MGNLLGKLRVWASFAWRTGCYDEIVESCCERERLPACRRPLIAGPPPPPPPSDEAMALSVALPLSGLETESFSTFGPFDLKSVYGLTQDSPSPSSSSESSGLGSLGSLPPSPHGNNNEKPPFVEKSPPPEPRVIYGGRDILDLRANVDPSGWPMTFSYLPPQNPAHFLNNRSQYHRLGGYAPQEFNTERCPVCGFDTVVA